MLNLLYLPLLSIRSSPRRPSTTTLHSTISASLLKTKGRVPRQVPRTIICSLSEEDSSVRRVKFGSLVCFRFSSFAL